MADIAKTDPTAGFDADCSQFLTFTIQGEEYGIEILRVQEIKGFTKVRPIPNAPRYVKGAMNLRGAVIPIVDLRCRLGMEEADYNQFTVIIVVSVGKKTAGLVVDAVSDVLNIARDQIDQTPDVGGDPETSFFQGMGKVGQKLVLLLNVDRLLAGEQVDNLQHAAV
jgi:purine-binding chemotaxis protein CheW